MAVISKGFNALLVKGKKLEHKFEVRVEIFSLGFYLLEFKDKFLVRQYTRTNERSAKYHLNTLKQFYLNLGCSIYELDQQIKFTFNKKTFKFEAKELE